MQPHETLPTKLNNYIKLEKLKISYLDLDNTLGFLYKKNIWVNKNIHLYKARFTIAHETGHYYNWDQNRWFIFWKLFKNYDEKKADEFALNMLLPKKELLEELEKYDWDLSILEKIFWVEIELIEKQIKKLIKTSWNC